MDKREFYGCAYTTYAWEVPKAQGEVAVVEHLEAIRAQLAGIDTEDLLEDVGLEDGLDLSAPDTYDHLLTVMLEGWAVHVEQYRYMTQYPLPVPPGHESLWVTITGALVREGADPYDGYQSLRLLLNACDVLPTLGRRLGILGTGIIVPGLEINWTREVEPPAEQ